MKYRNYAAIGLIIIGSVFTYNYQSNINNDIVAIVDSVYDGDTFYINIPDIHPVFGKHLGIRVDGIDTPEMHDKRPEVKAKAEQAKQFAQDMLIGKKVVLKHPVRDKYFRVRAEIFLETGENFGQIMLDNGFAKVYHGERRE